MPNVALTLAYEGTRFAGFQRQSRDRSVQGILEEALTDLTGETPEELRLAAAGRTDAGVHASGMVVNFRTTKAYRADTWVSALNARLPDDVAVGSAREVPDTFHSRFSAIARSYRYQVLARRTPDPLRRHTWHWEPRPLPEAPAMQRVFADLVGHHDFEAFGSTGSTPRGTEITVLSARCTLDGDMVVFEVSARSFLYHMVRRLVGAALWVGQGKWDPEDFRLLVHEGKQALKVPPTAPACGLIFESATYPPPYAGLFGPF